MSEFQPIQRIKEVIHWRRNEKIQAEMRKPELCFPGEVGGHFQDVIAVPSGVIFEQPEVQAMMKANKTPQLDIFDAPAGKGHR